MSRQYTASLYILVPTHNVYHPQGSVYKVSIGNESTARVNGSSGVKQDTGFPMTGNNVIKIQLLVPKQAGHNQPRNINDYNIRPRLTLSYGYYQNPDTGETVDQFAEVSDAAAFLRHYYQSTLSPSIREQLTEADITPNYEAYRAKQGNEVAND
ncbi:hypothetical protein [Lacticaseibacillus daqingensis]|uniref:hypothetical protein n=1 Tax=Lacticaseibacillus daqingensis TaxID=2486014 RepID=UPI000F7AA937|nr:hypothetical protein [Lacticaseibacillus daqingensis]